MADPLYKRIFARLSGSLPRVPYQAELDSAAKIESLRKQAEGIQKKIHALAEGASSIVYDPTIPPPIMRADSRGNPYRSYLSVVTAINRKYNNLEQYGCSLVKQVIDWRATQIAGNGANVKSEDEQADKFLQEFSKYNKLDGYRFIEMVREGEMEGKCLLTLEIEQKDEDDVDLEFEQQVCVKHVSWVQKGYEVKTSDDDYEEIIGVKIPAKDGQGEINLDPSMAVYVKLGSSRTIINQCVPRIANVLYDIDNLDRALADMRANNHLFGVSTPTIETPDESIADKLRRFVYGAGGKLKWVLGTMFIGTGKLTFAEPSGKAIESLAKECETLAKIISAATGIPIHFLGYADLLSNRSTAEELMEMVNATTRIEREIWKSKLEELCIKAINLYNDTTGSSLSTAGISVEVPVVTMQMVDLLTSIYLPLQQAGVISMQTLRQRIPGIDPEKEEELIEEEKQESMQHAADMADLMMKSGKADSMNSEDPSGAGAETGQQKPQKPQPPMPPQKPGSGQAVA